MLKRKSILVTLSLAIMFCFSLVLGLGVSNANVVYAASAPSSVTVKCQPLTITMIILGIFCIFPYFLFRQCGLSQTIKFTLKIKHIKKL